MRLEVWAVRGVCGVHANWLDYFEERLCSCACCYVCRRGWKSGPCTACTNSGRLNRGTVLFDGV